ncbi:MAG: 3-hydroxyacyl-ACP dehydratase FabZ [Armatimonadetes bacterium]|nr:3-hydroxyacyl-ACP dehydratase FabZ [Armatimonadota bacterium]
MHSPEANLGLAPDPVVAARYEGRELDVQAIMEVLPHRPPFLFLDRVLELEPTVRAVGIKAVTIGEAYFQGHFPTHPVMPGVLLLEAFAQLSGVLLLTGIERDGRLAYFTSVKEAKFRQPVRPGDTVRLESVARRYATRFGRLMCWFDCRAMVGGELAAEAEISFALFRAE